MCETLLEMTTPFAGSYYGPRVQASRYRGGRPRGGGRSGESIGGPPYDHNSFRSRKIECTAFTALLRRGPGRADRATPCEGAEREPGRAPGDWSAGADHGG